MTKTARATAVKKKPADDGIGGFDVE